MAIKLKTEIGDTGLTGDYWAPCDLQIRVGETAGTTVVARYALWASADAKAAGKAPCGRRTRKITVDVQGVDPRLSEIEAACDKALTVKTVEPVIGERAQAAEPARKADKAKGITPRPATKEVKGRRPERGAAGGELEKGAII